MQPESWIIVGAAQSELKNGCEFVLPTENVLMVFFVANNLKYKQTKQFKVSLNCITF